MTKPIPTLHGDGTHDDTAGFEALINGEPFKHDITPKDIGTWVFSRAREVIT